MDTRFFIDEFENNRSRKGVCPILTEENLGSLITHFAGDYNYYRSSPFPNNPY